MPGQRSTLALIPVVCDPVAARAAAPGPFRTEEAIRKDFLWSLTREVKTAIAAAGEDDEMWVGPSRTAEERFHAGQLTMATRAIQHLATEKGDAANEAADRSYAEGAVWFHGERIVSIMGYIEDDIMYVKLDSAVLERTGDQPTTGAAWDRSALQRQCITEDGLVRQLLHEDAGAHKPQRRFRGGNASRRRQCLYPSQFFVHKHGGSGGSRICFCYTDCMRMVF